jgi:hypothetical protein
MDAGTNHLVADLNSLKLEDRARYSRLPKHLQAEAERELAGRPDVYVNPNKQTALAQWAAKQRKKNRTRAKIARSSRKRNRAT